MLSCILEFSKSSSLEYFIIGRGEMNDRAHGSEMDKLATHVIMTFIFVNVAGLISLTRCVFQWNMRNIQYPVSRICV